MFGRDVLMFQNLKVVCDLISANHDLLCDVCVLCLVQAMCLVEMCCDCFMDIWMSAWLCQKLAVKLSSGELLAVLIPKV